MPFLYIIILIIGLIVFVVAVVFNRERFLVNNKDKARTLDHFNNLILDELKKNGINSWIAGGILRDYFSDTPHTSDCDIFFPSLSEFDKAKVYLLSKGAKVNWESENSIKVTYNGKQFDLVKLVSPTPIETINRFDFTISMFATDGNDVYYGNNSVKDLQNKNLVVNYISKPLSTLKRVLKHYKKGYSMSSDEIKKLYNLLYNLPLDSKALLNK